MNHDVAEPNDLTMKVTIRLPKTAYRLLTEKARDHNISLSQCVRDYLLGSMQEDRKMPKMQRALLYLTAEVLYYTRLNTCTSHPAWIVEANTQVELMVKKLLEEE